ncbi:hypothetical protein QTO34_015708 [Cnephaeus nilssonii]|uniref:MBD domain-containing protein n=1 Tax=Cnephaeus nilssonii TaxID=3371016 RepID=A0AA40I4L9_CNENI|nr:hypothetical protein QTO34_015708 [Eptesicus nilssonii]
MERKRWECPALPQGWEREEVPRRSGLSAGHRDVFYYRSLMKEPAGHLPPVECQLVLGGMQPGCGPRNWLGRYLGVGLLFDPLKSCQTISKVAAQVFLAGLFLHARSCAGPVQWPCGPSGKKFRSKPQLARYLGGSMDLGAFDFRTGKMLMSKMNKSRQRVRYDSSNQVKGKPDLNTALPVRQTASIFKQPVTKITNHPSNKVKSDPQKAVEQPRQLFWEKKLSGLNAFDIAEELVKTMDLPKGLQGVGPGCTDETLLSAIASALHTSTMPITGQLSAAVEKNPGVWLNTAQPLCKAFMEAGGTGTAGSKRLEEALMADMLAHVEELARDGEAPLDKPGAEEEVEDEEDEEEEPDQDQEMEHM